MTLVKFANGKREHAVNPWFNDVFKSYFNDSLAYDKVATKVPAVNIAETENEFQIELAAPGLKKEDFKISVDKNVLNLSAANQAEKDETKKYSSFERSFTLPESADQSKIDAEYVDGILKVTVAKKEETKIQSREISVK
jgi:HSP20 family protein